VWKLIYERLKKEYPKEANRVRYYRTIDGYTLHLLDKVDSDLYRKVKNMMLHKENL